MSLRQWAKTPKSYVLIITFAYLAIASFASQDLKGGLLHGAIAVGTALLADVICCLAEKRKRILPDGAFITGLIVALILSTSSPWYVVAATSVMSILPKHLLVHKKKPVFNPAALGLLLSSLLFHSQQSWWGAFGDLSPLYIALLLLGGYAVANRIQKFPQAFAFLGTYFILLFLFGAGVIRLGPGFIDPAGLSDALAPPFINAALFFALFMLTDPPTSPAKVRDQIVFGVIAAAVGAVIYSLYGGLIYLFIGLLAANFYHFVKSLLLQVSKQKQTRPRQA